MSEAKGLLGWAGRLLLLSGWLSLVSAETVEIAVAFNSNELPWFFPLVTLPPPSLVYGIMDR